MFVRLKMVSNYRTGITAYFIHFHLVKCVSQGEQNGRANPDLLLCDIHLPKHQPGTCLGVSDHPHVKSPLDFLL